MDKKLVVKKSIQEKSSGKSSCYLPARYVLSILLFWAMSLEFAQRVCLSVTIVAMVNHTALNRVNGSGKVDYESCPGLINPNSTSSDLQGEYIWTPSIQGIVLGAYFYGYVCTQVIGGRFAELAGGKWPLGLSILLASLLTIFTPIAADLGILVIVLVRVLMGLIHGICLPTAFALFAHWAPVEERSTMVALCLIGDHVGTVVAMPLAGYLCEYGFDGGWPSVFYILGLLGCVWFVFWLCLAYNTPSDHPRISKHELDYIQKGHVQMGADQKIPVPWRSVLCSMPVWSIAIVTFCAAWGFTTLLTKLPTYLEVVLHVPIQKNGLVNSFIYVCTCATLFASGYLSDYLRSKSISATKVRKGFEAFALFGPAVCTALIPLVGCNKNVIITLLALAMAFLGFCGGGHVAMPSDMAPHHAATIFGFVNGIGCTAGILSPLFAGFLLENAHASIEQWSAVFYISAGFYLLGGLVFLIWASAEKQPWAHVPSTEKLLKCNEANNERVINTDLEKSFQYGAIS